MEMLTYNLDWERQEGAMNYTARYKEGSPIPRPDSLAEMLNIAEKLANPFPVVRVDLYIANNRVYFGEMTFTSACGMMNYYTDDFLLHMGSMVDLEYKFTENKKNIV